MLKEVGLDSLSQTEAEALLPLATLTKHALEEEVELLEQFEQLDKQKLREEFAALPEEKKDAIRYQWEYWRREKQILPPVNWSTWLILAAAGRRSPCAAPSRPPA